MSADTEIRRAFQNLERLENELAYERCALKATREQRDRAEEKIANARDVVRSWEHDDGPQEAHDVIRALNNILSQS